MRQLWVYLSSLTLALTTWAQGGPSVAREELARVPFIEIAEGVQIGEWTVDAVAAEKKLVDGRSTHERCGYQREVQVHRPHPQAGQAGISPQALDKRSGFVAVTCVRNGDLLVPGDLRLLLEKSRSPGAQQNLTQAPAGPKPEVATVIVEAGPETAEPKTAGPETAGAQDQPPAASSTTTKPSDNTDQGYHQVQVGGENQGANAGVVQALPPPFFKGELSNLGAVRLINARDSVGLGLGADLIDDVFYAVLQPNVNFHNGDFALGLGTPIRFEVYDSAQLNWFQPDTYELGWSNSGNVRRADWDHALAYPYNDLLRPLRYLSWGRKEDHLYVDINRVRALTIGHGQLMRRYAPNADIENSRLFAELDAYNDYVGLEAIAGPLPIPRVAGALVFFKPLSFFLDDSMAKSLSIGLSYVTDLNAPTSLQTVTDPSSGRVRYLIDNGDFVYDQRDQILAKSVQGLGVDTEVKLVKNDVVDLKIYGDYSHLLFPAIDANTAAFQGGGATLGTLLRMSFGSRPVRDLNDESEAVRLGLSAREFRAEHAARFRAEIKTFSPQYLPSYFDTLYEVDRYQLMIEPLAQDQRALLPTKIAYLATQAAEPWRLGYYLEGTYTWVDRLAISAIYEDAWKLGGDFASLAPARNVVLHAETQGLGFLQLFATYHYHNFQLQDWSRILQFSSDNEVLYLGGRLQLLILAINLGVQRGFRLDALADDAGQVQLVSDGPVYERSSTGLRNQWNFMFNLELGWQF